MEKIKTKCKGMFIHKKCMYICDMELNGKAMEKLSI